MSNIIGVKYSFIINKIINYVIKLKFYSLFHLSILSASIVFILPTYLFAASAIQCHCFKDRTFDAANPSKVDPYLLATTQNSFFAKVFKAEKMMIVLKKQSGKSGEELWIGYYLAEISKIEADKLIEDRAKGGRWRDIAAKLDIKQSDKDIFKDGDDYLAASKIVDKKLVESKMAGFPELNQLRKRGAKNQEVILASLISKLSTKSPLNIYSEAANGQSWGKIANSAGINPKNIKLLFDKFIQ